MKLRERIGKFFRENFLSGVLVVVPVVVSIYIFVQILRWLYRRLIFLTFPRELLSDWLTPRLPEWAVDETIKVFQVVEFIVLLLLLFAFISFIGLVTKVGLFRWFFRRVEILLEKTPFIGIVYSAVKQLLQAIFTGKENFSKVVMVEFPRKGVWSLGFITRESDPSFTEITGPKRLYNIFIPTTPNVTTGFLLVLSEEEFHVLDLTVEQAFKFIMSGGMILPHEEADWEKADTLIARLKVKRSKEGHDGGAHRR